MVAVFSDELKNRFKEYITGRSGLYFKDHDLKNLEDVILKRAKSCGHDSPLAYYNHLTTSRKKEDEFRQLLNLLTIQHTYFFRNESQFRVLNEKVLPDIIKRKTEDKVYGSGECPSLRIWSAGCSTGEEPYSIAITIRDIIKDPDEWDIRIIATDASTEALEKAREGVYSGNSIKLLNEEHRKKYFTKKNITYKTRTGFVPSAKYEVQDTIKNMVHFSYLNLIDEDFPANFDIIFCRNVVIYFELKTTINVMNRLSQSLAGDGYLFIGYSESLQFISDRFRMEDHESAIFYRKVLEESVAAPGEPLVGIEPPAPAITEADRIMEELSKAEIAAGKKDETKKYVPPKKIEELLVRIIKAVHLKKYNEALSCIKEAQAVDRIAADPDYLAAEIYANQGKFDEAKERLRSALELNTFFAPAYYLFGSIFMEEEDLEEAEKNLKKALYLDRDFVLAHFGLAMICKKKNRTEDALRGYKNALKILSGNIPGDIIAYSGGLNSATLTSVCKNNIERLKVEQ